MANTITIKGDPVREEYTAAAAITPGHLCEITSAGTIQAHSTAGGFAEKLFAIEDELQGKEITEAYDATTNKQVLCGIFRPGDQVYALLANGETAVIGSKLESQGDGTLRVVDTDVSVGDIAVQSIVAVALEAVDMSGSSGADPSGRITIRIV